MAEIKTLEIPVDVKIRAAHPHLAEHFHAQRWRVLESRRRGLRVHIGRKGLSGGRCIILLIGAAGLEYTGFFQACEPGAKSRRQALAKVAKVPVDAPRARTRTGEHQTENTVGMTGGISLRQNAAEGVTQHYELPDL